LTRFALLQAKGIQAIAVQADLTDESAVRSLIQSTLEKFGRLDVVVNCAADWKSKPLEEVTAQDVRHYFEVNCLSTFLCSQLAGLAMVQQKKWRMHHHHWRLGDESGRTSTTLPTFRRKGRYRL